MRLDKHPHRLDIERPIQFCTITALKHRHPNAVAGFEHVVVIDPGRSEIGQARFGQHVQRQVAKVTVVSLKQGELGHAQVYGVSGRQA